MMPPKKTAAEAATKSKSSSPDWTVEEKVKTTDAAVGLKQVSHPTSTNMIKEALHALDSHKGVSYQAIKGYIKQTYPSVDLDRFKHLLRKALMKGLENGTLVRSASSAESSGAQGRFKLAPKAKRSTSKTENSDPNEQKDPKPAKDEEKNPKKAGGTKKKETASGQTKSSEDSKPPKKSKEDKQVAASKVPKAKKPKAKKAQAKDEEEEETADSAKPKATRTGKASKTKAAEEGSNAPRELGRRGKKAAQ